MLCKGRNNDDHCCWLLGKPCPHLEENTQPGFRWTCGLRRELGDWDLVLEDKRYIRDVHSVWVSLAKQADEPVVNCRDWPDGKNFCRNCGANC